MAKHYKGRHRKQTNGNAKRVATAAAGLGVAGAGALMVAPAANAHDWSGVAMCESSGNWAINSGNGFYGGLQFTQSTWDAFKPAGAAARADLATQADQIAAAEATLKAQGVGAWPVCGAHLGWGGTTPGAEAPEPSSPTPPVATTCAWVQPVTGTKSQDFHGGHNGTDIAAPVGTPIYAATSGTIDIAGFNNDPGGYGNYVQQRADNGAVIQYGHVSEIHVGAGEYVYAGDLIGAVGNAGSSTGPHLHLRIDGVDPEAYLINQGVDIDWSSPAGCNAAPAPAPAPAPADPAPAVDLASGGASIAVVVSGDTLSAIAHANGKDWNAVWELNSSIVPNPDLIFPGQELRLN
ncbi:peptidoglycan DD-metalloendopeptidase family protein [Rhodococcus hoagii]|nr:peptidoglycan DD-metalloendopeptidase family protein [Prescottella equi]